MADKLFMEYVAEQVVQGNALRAALEAERVECARQRARADALRALAADEQFYETCSYCGDPFEQVDDYEWECGTDAQTCSVWCGRDYCNVDVNMLSCTRCEYGVCDECANDDGVCPMCVERGN